MLKKIIISILVFVAVIGGVVYYYIYKYNPSPENSPADLTAADISNPFPEAGRGLETSPQSVVAGSSNSPQQVAQENLTELTREPVSGMIFVAPTKDSKDIIVRYGDRTTGHIYDANLTTGHTADISNVTLPNIYELYWIRTADKGVFRYLKNTGSVESYFFKIGSAQKNVSASTTLGISYGYYLPSNITALSVAPASAQTFYLTSVAGGSEGFVENNDTQKKTKVFTSPIREWIADWPSDTRITLTTKAASGVPGYMYFLNPQTKAVQPVLSSIRGLTALASPSGNFVLYADDTLSLFVYNVKTGTSTALSINTLPEKCVWSRIEKETALCAVPVSTPQAAYPDAWYQGKVSFFDDIYKVYASSGTSRAQAGLFSGSLNQRIDAVRLVFSQDESRLTFINKKDETLWSLKLK